MNWLRIDLKKIILLAVLLSLPILSLNLQEPGENPWVLRPFSFLAGGIQETYLNFAEGIRSTGSRYLNLVAINRKNTELVEENSSLKAKLLNYDELSLENQRLKDLLQFSEAQTNELIAAEVVGLDIFSERSSIRISLGKQDGVGKGMAVIHPLGVVGYILSSSDSSSVVLLLTDRYAVIDARVQRSRARGVVKGISPSQAELVYLQRTDDVEIGDLIVSSGLDSIFPEGFPIARVDSVSKESAGITQEVILRPVIDTSHLEEVYVVKKVVPSKTDNNDISLKADKSLPLITKEQ